MLGIGIGIATLVILTIVLMTSMFDQRIRIETASSEALRQSEERFRSLVQNSSDIIAVVAADGTVGYISPSVKRILGYEPDNWNSAFELVHPDDLTKAESLLTQALRCPSVNIAAEFRLRHADGQARDFEVIVNNLLTEPGVAGIVTTCRDITERKRAELELQKAHDELEINVEKRTTELKNANARLQSEIIKRQESEERYRRLIETAAEGIWIIDAESKTSYANNKMSEMLGYTVEEMLGKSLFAFMDAEGQAIAAANVERRRQGIKEQHDFKFRRKDGSDLWAIVSTNPIFDRAGQYAGALGMITDITQRKQAEEALQKAHDELECRVQERTTELRNANEQLRIEIADRKRAEEEIKKLNEVLKCRTVELEAANKELEAFSYSVSHDLRAPLRAINGFSRILLNEYAPWLAPEARRYLQMVRDNAQQMGCLVDDLLTFSRLSRSPLKKQLVHPDDIVRQAIADLRYEQENRHVEMSIGDLPATEADPALLKQVWVNLLSNALKYTRQRQVARIEIGCQQIGSDSVYFVKDNGVGFDMQYAHKLFGVFQRLHRAEEYEGTGVGLAIVQRVIHRHGGRVWASSEVNIGATFYFTIGGDIPHDIDYGRNPVSGRQSQRRGIDNALVEKQ